MCVTFTCLFFGIKWLELRRFSELELRNSVSMHAHLYGNSSKRTNILCTVRTYSRVRFEWLFYLRKIFSSLANIVFLYFFMRSDSWSSLQVHGFTFQLMRDCISVENVNKPWLICFIANLIVISKRCTNHEALST